MNILKKKFFIKKCDKLIIKHKEHNIEIENLSENEETIIVPHVFRTTDKNFKILFYGDVLQGDKLGAILKLVSKSREVFWEVPLGTAAYCPKKANFFMVAIRIRPKTKIIINVAEVCFVDKYDSEIKSNLNNDTVVIVPGYPNYIKKYNFSFVHSRIKKYKERGLNVDVLVVNESEDSFKYCFEGINVTTTNYLTAREILQENKYKRILVHFFKQEYANMLDAVDISDSKLYIYVHGADLIYRDYNRMVVPYFQQPQEITSSQNTLYKKMDEIIEKYNRKNNVKWIFGTNWAKDRAESLNGIKFRNYKIIPCNIDNEIFKYEQKKAEKRKKIFTIKKFDNINTYSVDILVRAILELSKREIFEDLEFNIYGDGTEFDRLLKPLRSFKNININRGYLTHEQIARVHEENGIGLFPTRYETQGVSASEAAMSGLVVISGNVTAVPEVFRNNEMLCDKENYIEYADKIEFLYNNPDRFTSLSKEMHETMINNYSSEIVYKLEKDMFSDEENMVDKIAIKEPEHEKILTVAIASYNVEKYLKNGVLSLLRSNMSNKVEILIINDGSKDETAEIGKKLEAYTTTKGKSIVKLIDKENGGHGSAINKGIELATGRYFKLMDGDDYFDTQEFEKLLLILENENSDIILNNYVEDIATLSIKREMCLYDFMEPGQKYCIEDLCVEGYGFDKWGPLLSTSTFKTKMLKEGNFKISEKCFYVDMELNTYAFINSKTITYYPLNVYVYFIGRAGQSISRESYTKNYKNHEHVTLKIVNEYVNNDNISVLKKQYIKNKIIIPLIKCQYLITTEFFNNGCAFRSFDDKLKKYKEFYEEVSDKRIKRFRITHGKTIRIFQIYQSIKRRLKH